MSSDSESSETFDSSESMDESEDFGEEWGVIESDIALYQDEPLAEHVSGGEDNSKEERDIDGLTPTILEARYDGTVSVDSWLVNEQE